jgi:hypothetical protein
MALLMLRKTPVTIKSVVCQSWSNNEVVPSEFELEKLHELHNVPGCQVEFRVTNGAGTPRNNFVGGFYFALSRL